LNSYFYSQFTVQIRVNVANKTFVLQQNQQEFQMVVFAHALSAYHHHIMIVLLIVLDIALFGQVYQ
jgi:hypothetical protein